MIQKDFNHVIYNQLERCENLLVTKGAEYAPGVNRDSDLDRLAHFKKAAIIMNTTPRVALMGMLSKHLVSVSDMCTDGKEYSIEKWNEKITDSINYLLILRAMIEEEKIEKNRSKNLESGVY